MFTIPGWVVGWRGDWSCCCRGIPQSAPEGLFLFRKNPPAQSLAPSIQGRACPLTQPPSQARPGAVRARIAGGPTFNSPPPAPVVSHLSELQSPWSVWCRSQAPWSVPVVSVVHSPQCLGFGFNIPHTPKGAQGGCPGGEETGAAAAGEFPKVPLRVFFFLRKSSCSILRLPPYKEGPVLSHSPLLQLDQGVSGPGSHRAQLSTLPSQCPGSLWFCHFVLNPLSTTSSKQVSHSVAQALFSRDGSH